MAFGDGMNDFTMVEAAGLGIAMANAEPEVKRVAKDFVAAHTGSPASTRMSARRS